MQKMMFNNRYGMQDGVLNLYKTNTRRESFDSEKDVGGVINEHGRLECYTDYNGTPIHVSRYAIDEIVAIAQPYREIADGYKQEIEPNELKKRYIAPYIMKKGWVSKMFVSADLMPHHIRITDIRCERLQDISDGDCIKEGIYMVYDEENNKMFAFVDTFRGHEYQFKTPKEAFCSLIIALNGQKFWDSNPYVIVYDFKRID